MKMRKITEITVDALSEGKTKKLWNSEVCWWLACWDYYLHDNLIAMYNPDKNELWISDAGRRTNTTKERLNGILKKWNLWRIFQKNWQWIFYDAEGRHERTGQRQFEGVKKFFSM